MLSKPWTDFWGNEGQFVGLIISSMNLNVKIAYFLFFVFFPHRGIFLSWAQVALIANKLFSCLQSILLLAASLCILNCDSHCRGPALLPSLLSFFIFPAFSTCCFLMSKSWALGGVQHLVWSQIHKASCLPILATSVLQTVSWACHLPFPDCSHFNQRVLAVNWFTRTA